MTKNELKQLIRECLREELIARNTLNESTNQYADFVTDEFGSEHVFEVGDKAITTIDLDTFTIDGGYAKVRAGSTVTILEVSHRGYDVVDANGNEVDEVRWNCLKPAAGDLTEAVDDGWYGAYSEVEFDTSVYPDIAKYFKLPPSCHVVDAFWYMDEVTVEYEGGAGTRYQIEKHVPLGQVEEWFKAGYTLV